MIGRLNFVGAVLEPINVSAMPLIVGQKSISGSSLATPAACQEMVEFCARHKIAPKVEYFAMPDCNRALQHLREGKARYRAVLVN